MVTQIFPTLDSSLTTLVQFSSRKDASKYLAQATFSIFLTMMGYNWLLIAPLPLCQIIQTWAADTPAASVAIIRVFPTISAAYSQLSLSLADGARMVFLSHYTVTNPSGNLSDQGYVWPNLPPNPTGSSSGFHSPISILIVAPPFQEDCTADRRTFQIIWADENHKLRYDVAVGHQDLCRLITSSGRHFIIPFPEPIRAHSLAFRIMQALPDCGWPVVKLSPTSILEALASRAIPAPTTSFPLTENVSHPISSQGCEGQV